MPLRTKRETPHSQCEVLTLDLHGRRPNQIYGLILDFIKMARRQREGIVIIITGKGTRSEGPAVLKPAAKSILTQLQNQGDIHDFAVTPGKLGGGGAFLVELSFKNGK